MVFSTPIFMFYFLVFTLFLYYIVPRRGRNVVLLLSSLFFYYWGERVYVAIMFLSTAIDYTHGLLVERYKSRGNDRGARMAVASSVIFYGDEVTAQLLAGFALIFVAVVCSETKFSFLKRRA